MEGVMPSAPDKTPSRIAGMFDAIAPRYDLLNHLLSAGLDRRWRERAVDALELKPGTRVLDLCTGTADVAIAAAHRATKPSIVGIDFAGTMLVLGLQKVRDQQLDRQIQLVRGDATRIPVADGDVPGGYHCLRDSERCRAGKGHRRARARARAR